MNEYFVYLLECKDGTLYTGITNNLQRRIAQHNAGKGAIYTRGRRPVKLLKSFAYLNKSEALKLECKIKKLSRADKLTFQSGYIEGEHIKKGFNMKENLTAIAVIIDASGSMHSLTHDTIGSFNQFLTEQKAVPGEAIFSLCTFNDSYHLVHDFVTLSNVSELTIKTYSPSGGTALLDAMGTTIDNLGAKLAALPEEERASKVIVLVITDGHENASSRYTREQIREKVSHQQEKYSWSFVFLGANIDAFTAGTSMGFTRSNSVNYQATAAGTKVAYNAISSSMTSYRLANVSHQADFFSPSPIDLTGAVVKTDTSAADMLQEKVPVSSTLKTPPPTHNIKFDPGQLFPVSKKINY